MLRTPPLRARAVRGWARGAATGQPPERKRDPVPAQYRDTVLLPRTHFPAQLPGRLQLQAELETQQVRTRRSGAWPGPERKLRLRLLTVNCPKPSWGGS